MKLKTLIVSLFVVAMLGCSNLTPQQAYDIDRASIIGADVALTIAVNTGKIPATAVPQIQKDMGVATANLAAFKAWLAANPNLANTIGVYPAELGLAGTATQILLEYVTQYSLIVPLPSAPAPAK